MTETIAPLFADRLPRPPTRQERLAEAKQLRQDNQIARTRLYRTLMRHRSDILLLVDSGTLSPGDADLASTLYYHIVNCTQCMVRVCPDLSGQENIE